VANKKVEMPMSKANRRKIMIRLDKKTIPDKPGVYFFRDNKRQILYIGKAAKLRNRLGSYFDSRPKDPRIEKMLNLATSAEYQIANSEIEALILESQFIKKYKPSFNIMLRDDKQYFFVVFTKDKFPKILITHQPTNQEKYKISQAIGPFTDGSALRSTLKLLRKAFPYCTCKQKHNNYCLNYHIGKCLGFCCLKNIDATNEQIKIYKKNIQAIKDILNGKRTTLNKKIEKEMMLSGKQNNFEEAIKLRTQLERLKQVFENVQVIQELGDPHEILSKLKKTLSLPTIPIRIEGYDISNIQGEFATGAMVAFINDKPDKNEYRKFKIYGKAQGDTAMLQEVLNRRFKHREWQFPDLILMDGGKGQLSIAVSTLKNLGLDIPIIALTKNEKHAGDHIFSTTFTESVTLVKLPQEIRNLVLNIDAEAHRFAISYYRNLHNKNMVL
jgi:excinuclease ABC subunit C